MPKRATASFFALFFALSLSLFAEDAPKPGESNADDKDLCSYLKDVDAKADADCGQDILKALKGKDPAAYSQKLELAHKRKADVLKAYEFLKAQPAPNQQTSPHSDQPNRPSPTQLQPPINERTFPAWIGPEASDLKEVYTRWLQAQDQELQQEKKAPVSPERSKEIEAALKANQAKIAALGKIKDPAELSCFLGETCGRQPDLPGPSGQTVGTGKGTWSQADFERANAEAKRQNVAPGGKLDGGAVPTVGGVASEVVANTPLRPLFEKPKNNQSNVGTVATMALTMAGALFLLGGLGGKQLEEKFPGITRNMGLAVLLGGAVATGVMAWEASAARVAATAIPLAANPQTEEEASEALPAAQRVVQRVAQSVPNVAPQASASLQQTAVLEQEMSQEFSALRTIGQTGSSPRIRLMDEGVQDAQAMFQRLSRFGKTLTGTTYRGQLTELPNGARVGLRLVSKSGPPTIDVHNFPGFPDNLEIKFLK